MQKDIRYRLLCIGTLLATALLLLSLSFLPRQVSSTSESFQIQSKTLADHGTYFDSLHTLIVTQQDGRVCVLRDGTTWIHTEISVQALPERDRLLLEDGIVVQSEQEMHQLLEDLGG